MVNTLILNNDGSPLQIVPLSVISWQDAIKMEWLDRASVIDEYEDWIVRSPSIEMAIPSILMLNEFTSVAKDIKYSRYNVFLRDEFKCQYCSYDGSLKPYSLTIDHVLPRALGGKTKWDNVVTACQSCNFEKAHYQTMKPRNAPEKPTYWTMVGKRKKYPIAVPKKSWISFLGWDEKLVAIKGY